MSKADDFHTWCHMHRASLPRLTALTLAKEALEEMEGELVSREATIVLREQEIINLRKVKQLLTAERDEVALMFADFAKQYVGGTSPDDIIGEAKRRLHL